MRRWLFSLTVVVALLALAACAAKEEAPFPGRAAPAAPAAAPAAPAAKPAWEEEWERVLAAAKREGKIALAGPAGAAERQALTEGFTRKYGIAVDYLGVAGPEFPTRIRAEREAGQYLWDIFVGGTTTMITAMKPMGALDPIDPALILPEVKDPKNWREGKPLYVEKDKLGLVMTPSTRESLFVNTNLADPREFRSYRDLLDPKWKGKMVVGRDPRIAGPGQATFTLFYRHPNLGPDFIRALLRQEMTILRDDTQSITWLAEGRFHLLVGGSPRTFKELKGKGLPIKEVDPRQLREGGDISPGVGSVSIINRAAHPNAARVYLNWLLSKEGQSIFAKVTDLPTWRADVPWQGDPWVVPQPGYIDTYSEEAMAVKEPLVELLREILGR